MRTDPLRAKLEDQENHEPRAKMAGENSMLHELLSEISPYNFREKVMLLRREDYVDPVKFHRSQLGKSFWIDIRNIYRNGSLNYNHILQLFGKYSGHEGEEVRKLMYDKISQKEKLYTSVGRIFFDLGNTSMG